MTIRLGLMFSLVLFWSISLDHKEVTGLPDLSSYFAIKEFKLAEIPVVTPYQLAAQEKFSPMRKIKIAIVDTGVDFSHKLLAPFKSSQQKTVPSQNINWHGTHVAGIVAQHLNSVYGVKATQLFEIENFYFTPHDLLSYQLAVAEAALSNAQIINLSVWGEDRDPLESSFLDYAYRQGKKIIVSAGNHHSSIPEWPCNYSYVTCVGNLNNFFPNSTSNFGPQVTVWAQGTEIFSSTPGQTWSELTGTSQSSPVVAAYYASIMVNPSSKAYFDTYIYWPKD